MKIDMNASVNYSFRKYPSIIKTACTLFFVTHFR